MVAGDGGLQCAIRATCAENIAQHRRTTMGDPVNVILGFDPGGRGNFGWSICPVVNGRLAAPFRTGLADQALHAVQAVQRALPGNANVLAAGIDAPLLWSRVGNRDVDQQLRNALNNNPFPIPRVIALNSLWGAVTVQGVLVAYHVAVDWPCAVLTESHPRALRCLLHAHGQPATVAMVDHLTLEMCDHELDATLAAVSAWAATHQNQPGTGWQNLYEQEPGLVAPFDFDASYWMPMP